jgi:hypothetical protein
MWSLLVLILVGFISEVDCILLSNLPAPLKHERLTSDTQRVPTQLLRAQFSMAMLDIASAACFFSLHRGLGESCIKLKSHVSHQSAYNPETPWQQL